MVNPDIPVRRCRATLDGLAHFDWKDFLLAKLEGRHRGAPLDGIERGGYRLVYRDEPSSYFDNLDLVSGVTNLTFSIGLAVGSNGQIEDVLWDGPGYRVGLTAGSEILKVNGDRFSAVLLKQAVGAGGYGVPIRLSVRRGNHERQVVIDCPVGHRYPQLEPIAGIARRLDDILAPRVTYPAIPAFAPPRRATKRGSNGAVGPSMR